MSKPTISYLEPDVVDQGIEVVVKVHGTDFDPNSFVLIDGRSPITVYKTANLLEVTVDREITSTVGGKVIKVHTGDGTITNEKILTVRQKKDAGDSTYGLAKIKSYFVTATVDKAQYSRREIKMVVEHIAGAPITGVTLIFVDDNPLTDLGSYGGWVLARAVHRDFDNMYEILRTEKTACFAWAVGDQNKLSWFAITTDNRG